MRGHTDDFEARGIVFDLQRFALHDGPGIRTTIFLKGCPLSCVWCHNPESQGYRFQLSFDADRCVHCVECVDVCPAGALTAEDGRLVVRHDLCTACGDCVPVCAESALSIVGREQTAREVIEIVERDRVYYEKSGGGLTISGGEPLAQPDFAQAVLRLAKERGIHTCLDTSGAVHPRRLQAVLPYVDLFLFDYKVTEPDLHKELTGVSNELILENLEYLSEKGADVILRCPLVPGLNDSSAHLQAIGELSHRYPRLRGVEIMAYHDMGRKKACQIGFENPLADVAAADEADKARWLAELRSAGCDQAVIG